MPWLIWAKEQSRRETASLTNLSLLLAYCVISFICPLVTIADLPVSLKEMLARVRQTLYWIAGFLWLIRFIRRLIISVERALGVPSSPCIRILSNTMALSRISGNFSSMSLSTSCTKIFYFERIQVIPSVY